MSIVACCLDSFVYLFFVLVEEAGDIQREVEVSQKTVIEDVQPAKSVAGEGSVVAPAKPKYRYVVDLVGSGFNILQKRKWEITFFLCRLHVHI